MHIASPAHLHDGPGGVAEGAGGVHHVVKEDAVLPGHIADDIHYLTVIGLLPTLIHNGQTHVQLLGEGAAPGHAAHIGRHHHHVLHRAAELLGIVVNEHGIAQQVIHGDVEKALDLGGVQVHGQHPVGAGSGDHIGHQLGADGVTALSLAVLPGIAEVGHHGGDAACGGALAGIDHDEQLHEAVVYGLAGGVDKKDIAAANSLVQGDRGLAVGEMRHLGVAQLGADDLADLLCQGGVGIAGEDLDVLTMRNHFEIHSLSFVIRKLFSLDVYERSVGADTSYAKKNRQTLYKAAPPWPRRRRKQAAASAVWRKQPRGNAERYESASHGTTLPFRSVFPFIIPAFLVKSSVFPKKRKKFFILEKNTAALEKIRGILHSPSLKNLDSKK